LDIEKTLKIVNQVFKENLIEHALIGGMVLTSYGVNLSTYDVDMLIDEKDKSKSIGLLESNGFKLEYESEEVCQFQDKADIQALTSISKELDWDRIKKYAELFNEWEFIKRFKKS
jgi:hypothetical protein